MSKLVNTFDVPGQQLWSQIQTDAGEIMAVEIAAGFRVQKSRWGVFYKTIFQEPDLHRASLTSLVAWNKAVEVNKETKDLDAAFEIVSNIRNVALKGFTIAALIARSADQYVGILERSRKTASEMPEWR